MTSNARTDILGSKHSTKNFADSKDNNDKYRMWAATSFAVMLLVVGIPLWWKTTEVHRVALPYNRISQLNPSGLRILVNISIYTEYPTRTNNLIQDLQSFFSTLGMYRLNLKPQKIDVEELTVEMVEESFKTQPKIPGSLFLIQVQKLPKNSTILLSSHRVIYFTSETTSEAIGELIKNTILDEKSLLYKVMSILNPEKMRQGRSFRKRLRASLNYDVIFTIINSDPEHINLSWDIEAAINAYIQPLFEQINLASYHKAKSQWLYLVDLDEKPSKTKEGDFLLTHAQLPHIITPLEKKLGSGISKHPCVHMILYTPSCDISPLSFLSINGEKVVGITSPEWGAIQILNPGLEHCSENRTLLTPLPQKLMANFLSQFHKLLGLNSVVSGTGVEVVERRNSLLHDWELDFLYRLRAVEQITSASLTLQSLAKLLGEISNIVINKDVAGSVELAVDSVEKAIDALKYARLEEALLFSRSSFKEAETAFSNPTLLALLYFPDDQKYAVYIPLFLPVMIPVLMSLKNIYRWLFNIKQIPHEKED